jgi:hypothetical protein
MNVCCGLTTGANTVLLAAKRSASIVFFSRHFSFFFFARYGSLLFNKPGETKSEETVT